MDFDSWTAQGVDPVRTKRLLIGYSVGFAGVAAGVAFVFLTASGAAAEKPEEQPLEVQLVTEPEPEPEPPEPEPEPVKVEAPKAGPRMPKLQTPTEVPEDKPVEAEVKPQDTGDGDPYANAGTGSGAGTAEKAVVAAPAPAPPPPSPPKPKGPVRLTENMTAPKPLSNAKPEYPADLAARGVEGVVIVKYVVSESGVVTAAKVLKGPPELHAVCLSAVKSWRFEPARSQEGEAVSVIRLARFPFKIKT